MSPAPLSPAPLSAAPNPAVHAVAAVRARAVGAAALGVLGLLAGVLAAAPVASASPVRPAATTSTAGHYYSITPTRVLDTRPNASFAQGETRTIDLSPAIPVPASAAVLNLTVTNPTAGGYITVFPSGTARPVASSLNKSAGQTRANAITVAVGQGAAGGQNVQNRVDIYNQAGRSDIIVDVVGYYSNGGGYAGAGSTYHSLGAPVRLFDTRSSIGALSNSYPRNVMFVYIDYGSPAVNKTISAVAMNMTVTQPSAPGYLTFWNGQGAVPGSSSLNYDANQTVANSAVVPVVCADSGCTRVTFSVKNNVSPSTQVVGDIAGMYAIPGAGGLVYQAQPPLRVTDSRSATPYGQLGSGSVGMTPLSSVIGNTTRAVNVNVTAVQPNASTYLTIYPSSVSQPPTSTINVAPGDIICNGTQVAVGKANAFDSYNAFGSINVVADLQGQFLQDPYGSSYAQAAAAGALPAGSAPTARLALG